MKTILLFLLIIGSTPEVQEVPENIEYYEFCYMSNSCEVPTKYLDLVEKRILDVKQR